MSKWLVTVTAENFNLYEYHVEASDMAGALLKGLAEHGSGGRDVCLGRHPEINQLRYYMLRYGDADNSKVRRLWATSEHDAVNKLRKWVGEEVPIHNVDLWGSDLWGSEP